MPRHKDGKVVVDRATRLLMDNGQTLSFLGVINNDRKEIVGLVANGCEMSIQPAQPAIIENGDPDEDYGIKHVSNYVGSYSDGDDVEINYEIERIIEICPENSDEIICAFFVTPEHDAIYIYRNLEYPPEFCDEVAKLLEGYNSEVTIA